MTQITPNRAEGTRLAQRAELKPSKVAEIISAIDADILLMDTATATQQREILKRMLRFQKKMVQYISTLD